MKKVLITGAYGFLGKYTIKEFVQNGYNVFAFGKNEDKLKELEDDNVSIIKGDFCIYNDIFKATIGMDYVVHCGALSTIWGLRDDFIRINVIGTKNVLKACINNNVKKIVYVSSPSIYTECRNRENISEDNYNDNNHLNYYIESKILAEKVINETRDIDWAIIRPRGLFGIGDTSIIPRLIKANSNFGIPLFNNGSNLVDMTCVENVAYVLRLCIEVDKTNHNVYNITNDEPQCFKDILEKLFKELNIVPKYRYINTKVMYFIAGVIELVYKIFCIHKEPPFTKYSICTLAYSQSLNIEKAKNDLGYKPIISLDAGISKYAKKYNKNHSL